MSLAHHPHTLSNLFLAGGDNDHGWGIRNVTSRKPWSFLGQFSNTLATSNISAFVIQELLHVLIRFLMCFFLAGMLFLSLARLQSLFLKDHESGPQGADLGQGPPSRT